MYTNFKTKAAPREKEAMIECKVSYRMDNPQLGISAYDHVYASCRCVYCNEIVLLLNTTNSQITLDALYQDIVERRRDAYNGNDFYLTLDEEAEIRRNITIRESGESIGYEQCIHYRCLEIVQRAENSDVLARIRLANRQNIELPDAARHTFYDLNYTNVTLCVNYCGYCRREINRNAPGFAYCLRNDKARRCLFLHVACFEGLKEMRCRAQRQKAEARRHFFHFLTFSRPSPVKELAARHEAWVSFLSEYALDYDERHVFNDWLFSLISVSALWNDLDRQIWLKDTKEDLVKLTQELSLLSEEELLRTERDLLATPPPIDPLCLLVAPQVEEPLRCIPYIAPPLPKQLQLNLIASLRQARIENPPI